MKENPRYKDIPVIFLTAKDDEANIVEGLNLGAVDYVTKPISGPVLLRRISNIMQIEQQRIELDECHGEIKKLREQTSGRGG